MKYTVIKSYQDKPAEIFFTSKKTNEIAALIYCNTFEIAKKLCKRGHRIDIMASYRGKKPRLVGSVYTGTRTGAAFKEDLGSQFEKIGTVLTKRTFDGDLSAVFLQPGGVMFGSLITAFTIIQN